MWIESLAFVAGVRRMHARVHSMLEKSLKMLEFGIKTSRPLKCLKTDKVLENPWKVLEFKFCICWQFWSKHLYACHQYLETAFDFTLHASVSNCSLKFECPRVGYGFLSIILVLEKCNLGPWKSLKSAWIFYFEFATNPGMQYAHSMSSFIESDHHVPGNLEEFDCSKKLLACYKTHTNWLCPFHWFSVWIRFCTSTGKLIQLENILWILSKLSVRIICCKILKCDITLFVFKV